MDFLFTLGQAISAVLFLYGGYLSIRHSLFPKRKAPTVHTEDDLLEIGDSFTQ
jgi:hypothetical protein